MYENKEIRETLEKNKIELNFHIFNESFCSNCIFTTINNRELDLKESGIENISQILTKQYSSVDNFIPTDLKHKIVFEEIEKMSRRNFVIKSENEVFKDDSLINFIFDQIFDSDEDLKLGGSATTEKSEEIPFIKFEDLKLNLVTKNEYEEEAL